MDIYLHAETEAEMHAALAFMRDDDGWIDSPMYSIDVIGPVVLTTSVIDADGNEVTPAVIDDRFHVNLRCEPSIADQIPNDIKHTPDAPMRVWA